MMSDFLLMTEVTDDVMQARITKHQQRTVLA